MQVVNFVNGNNGSSRFLDLDPNSIADVQVLKGLSAATLYGEAGKNGVILITTKAGAAGATRKKNEITVTQSYFMNEIASMPDYQDQYGNGFDQKFGWFFSNWGPAFRKEGSTGYGNASNFPSAYGLNTDDGTILHPYSTASSVLLESQQPSQNLMGQDISGNLTTLLENFFKQVQLPILHFRQEVLQLMVKYLIMFLLVT